MEKKIHLHAITKLQNNYPKNSSKQKSYFHIQTNEYINYPIKCIKNPKIHKEI